MICSCVRVQMLLREPSFRKHELTRIIAKLQELVAYASGLFKSCVSQLSIDAKSLFEIPRRNRTSHQNADHSSPRFKDSWMMLCWYIQLLLEATKKEVASSARTRCS